MCLIDVDSVAHVETLRAAGFEAEFLRVEPDSESGMQRRIEEAVAANPPEGYIAQEAAKRMFQVCKCLEGPVGEGVLLAC